MVAGVAVLALRQPVTAASAAKRRALAAQGPETATQSAGNGIYTVYVEDSGNTGLYTATTGPSHPAGNGLNVFYGDGDPGTTFNTIRSYTSGTDYVQRSGVSSGNTVVELFPFGSVSPIGSTGYRTTYNITSPDALTIIQDVNVNGTTFDNSSVSVTTTVQNNGAGPVQIGIRYLWDYEIGDDDGPTFQAITPNGPVLLTEAEFDPPGFVQYRIVDNDNNPNPPTFFIFGTATGPSSLVPMPTVPGRLQYASWEDSVDTAFDYAVDPSLDIASESLGVDDSAVLYYFGPTRQSAITIPAGGSASVTALAFLSSSSEPPGGGAKQAPALGAVGLAIVAGFMLLLGVGTLSHRKPAR